MPVMPGVTKHRTGRRVASGGIFLDQAGFVSLRHIRTTLSQPFRRHRSRRTEKSMRFSAKRSAYSDMPSFSSQSAICCIAANPLRPSLTAFYARIWPIVSLEGAIQCQEQPRSRHHFRATPPAGVGGAQSVNVRRFRGEQSDHHAFLRNGLRRRGMEDEAKGLGSRCKFSMTRAR